MKIPRIVLAGTHSGAGKTTLTLGLLMALRRRGLRVQPFKVGPDYIDPGLHQVAAGRVSHNLDSWMGCAEAVRKLFIERARDSDIAIVEGVMGLYDGARGQGEMGSTAQVAKIIQAPVVLVFLAKGLARSAAALLKGYCTFDPAVNISGVIANGVGSERHRAFLEETLAEEVKLPLLGTMRQQKEIVMPERQLGLLPAAENSDLAKLLQQLGALIEEQVDIDKVLQLAQQAPALEAKELVQVQRFKRQVRLAVARDEAFHFYYEDSLDYLREQGAELLFFSPLRDRALPPDIAGIYIGGGFPEEFLPTLSANQVMKQQLEASYHKGMPIYAECGGLMYLCSSITNLAGQVYHGVGLVPGQVKMGKRLAALGYVRGKTQQPSIFGEAGVELKGHEFHWSTMEDLPGEKSAYQLTGGRGRDGRWEGYVQGNLLASYLHLHFRYNQQVADNYLAACVAYKEKRGKDEGQ